METYSSEQYPACHDSGLAVRAAGSRSSIRRQPAGAVGGRPRAARARVGETTVQSLGAQPITEVAIETAAAAAITAMATRYGLRDSSDMTNPKK